MRFNRLHVALVIAGTLLLRPTAHGETVILSEDFESYASTAQLAAVWNASSRDFFETSYALATDVGNPGNSYRMNSPGENFKGRIARNLPGGPVQASSSQLIVFSMDMLLFEEGAGALWGGARHYIELRSYADGAFAQGALQEIIAIGVFNNSTNPHSNIYYQGRAAFTAGVNWQTLRSEPDAPGRATGWHNLKAVISDVDIKFYVDEILAHVSPRGNNVAFDSVVLGSDLTANFHTAWIDNVKVSVMDAPAPEATIENAFVYHDKWSGQGSPIDAGKSLHKEGDSPSTLTYDNLINTARGINGIGFDILGLADAGALSASDFEFQMSPPGAFSEGGNPPAGWASAPPPSSISVTEGSPDQVLILWPDDSIKNRWLRVTVKANAVTGLAADEVYYLGHLLGETTGPLGSLYTVAFADISEIRAGTGQTVNSSSPLDIDKNGTVSFADISVMRANVGAQLTNITVP
jgi:hypothetical protein